jgi:hypothetical protein
MYYLYSTILLYYFKLNKFFCNFFYPIFLILPLNNSEGDIFFIYCVLLSIFIALTTLYIHLFILNHSLLATYMDAGIQYHQLKNNSKIMF